jgi:hypothetical protein
MIAIKTAPESYDLTTLTAVELAGELTLSAAEQTEIGKIISRVSRQITQFCQREFARQVLTETLPGYGGVILQVGETQQNKTLPLISIDMAKYKDDTVDATTYTIADAGAGQIYRQQGWLSTQQAQVYIVATPLPDQHEQSYTLEYTAGYILPSFANQAVTGDLLPADVEEAAIRATLIRFHGRPSFDKREVKRVNISGEINVEFFAPAATGLPSEIQDILINGGYRMSA